MAKKNETCNLCKHGRHTMACLVVGCRCGSKYEKPFSKQCSNCHNRVYDAGTPVTECPSCGHMVGFPNNTVKAHADKVLAEVTADIEAHEKARGIPHPMTSGKYHVLMETTVMKIIVAAFPRTEEGFQAARALSSQLEAARPSADVRYILEC